MNIQFMKRIQFCCEVSQNVKRHEDDEEKKKGVVVKNAERRCFVVSYLVLFPQNPARAGFKSSRVIGCF